MCIIIPIDHMLCSHTVAIWQHCANAPRSVFGHKPCSHIRQHGRPILTRKICHNCGGPRFFARRGGLAARGSGSSVLGRVKEQHEDLSEQYDSGYQSDLIPEADDEADFDDASLSPLQQAASVRKWRDLSRQRLSNIPRSSGQKSNWRPNLKRDLSESSSSTSSIFSSRRPSIESTLTQAHSITPIIRSPSPPRKGSTLLHPSTPPMEPSEIQSHGRNVSFQDFTPPATPPQGSEVLKRQSSTLLHPSPPQLRPVSDLPDDISFPFAFSLPAPVSNPPSSAPVSTSAPDRPPFIRKNSTLLHPSSPDDDISDPYPIPAKTVISLPPTPQTTPTIGCHKRCTSTLNSSPLDDDWEEPLHSSHSDAEYDSDDDQSVEANAPRRSSIKVARLAHAARASRISFHGDQLRILRD